LEREHNLLASAYRLFNVRDLEGVLRLMHKDVDWPNGMEGGRVHGHDGVSDYWTRQWKILDPHVAPVGFETNDSGDTVVAVHQVVRDLEGKVLVDQMVNHVYTFEDGLIRTMQIRGTEIRDGEAE